MHSILNSGPSLGPAVERKIAYVRILGISCVLFFFLLVCVSFMGYFSTRVFWLAVFAETLSMSYTLRKINSFRSPASAERVVRKSLGTQT